MNVSLEGMRRGRIGRWLLLLLLYLAIAAAFIGANPLRGETTGPFDLLVSYPGWNPDGQRPEVRHGARSDILDALLPEWIEARRQVREGTMPLWNPLRAGGSASLLNPTNAELSVGFAMFALTPDPALGFYLSVLVTMAIAGLGAHLLVSQYCGPWPSVFSGISYMACGFITAWLFWPHTHSAAWIPWVLLAVTRFASKGSTQALAGIAATTALMFLGGFPFVVALGLGAALLHGAVAVRVSLRHIRPIVVRYAGVVAGLAIGLALTGIPLMTMVSDFSSLDLSYRTGGSGLSLELHRKLLLLPWASQAPQVESNMYVGMSAMLLALVGIANVFRPGRNTLAITGAWLFLVGALLTFGLLPREIGVRLPVLSNNPWNRAILLLDFGLILLAAVGAERLLARVRWKWVAIALAVAICAVQAMDLGRQFRKFNGATPSRYFYPVSPALAALKREVRPFQYVAQDSSYFLISGSLGGIGLAEWYAHALKPPPTRELLEAMAKDPFVSKTATAIGVRDYHWRDQLLDEAGLCYAAYPKGVAGRASLASSGKIGRRTPLEPINGVDVVQEFRLREPAEVRAISINMATYRATGLDGQATLSVVDAGNHELVRVVRPVADIVDNAMTAFELPLGQPLPAGVYRFRLHYAPGPKNLRLTAWVAAEAPGRVQRDGRDVPGSLVYEVLGPPDGSLLPIAESGSVVVARNSGCMDGAYRSTSLDRPLAQGKSGATRLRDYVPHRFEIESAASEPGFVIVPMQMREGWHARVDGEPADILRIHGVMPAVAVPAGSSRVEFDYQPPRWRRGAALTLSGLLALLAAWILRRRRQLTVP